LAANPDTAPTGTRLLALALLGRVERGGAFADRLLSSPRVMALDRRDRAFVRELVLGVLRWRLRLDHTIDMYYTKETDSLDADVRAILRLGLFQLMFMDAVPDWAAVSESVALARQVTGRGPAGLVNAILRRFLREGEPAVRSDDIVDRLAVGYAHPHWMVRRWIDAFGIETAEAILDAGNRKHPVTMHANTLKSTPEDLIGRLADEGFEAAGIDGVPGFLALTQADGLFESRSFKEGLFTVQDPSTERAVEFLDPRPGERLLDLCAAPGGKTVLMAQRTGDRADITAVDINPARLGLVKETAGRLGLASVRCVEGDAATFRPGDGRLYDRVLCDVPCTGTAVFSKRPDMKWRRDESDIARMTLVQREILASAYALVKPGGVIVYSTCTLEHEENEDTVAWFSEHYPVVVESAPGDDCIETAAGCLLLPQRMNGTGAFVAKLRKKREE